MSGNPWLETGVTSMRVSGKKLVWREYTAYKSDGSFKGLRTGAPSNNQSVNSPSEFEDLSDDQLAALATQWRTRALHGERDANGRAHELERELRQRSGAACTLGAALRGDPRQLEKPW